MGIEKKKLFGDVEVIIDPNMNKYQNVIFNPKKLARANDMIAKYGVPEEWEKAHPLCVSGVLEQANRKNNTFIITQDSDNKVRKSNYTISTISETLNELVKKHWGTMLTVYIKPIPSKNKRPRYELIEVRA
jgi:hypothetical protein